MVVGGGGVNLFKCSALASTKLNNTMQITSSDCNLIPDNPVYCSELDKKFVVVCGWVGGGV